ncbi:hypothetical protein GCM10010441_37530 [Kitasatospora paracochleata]|uniref:Uncharacterized protein n=1 Tax=Kitasatospora paracochleata TaxID=58354 RepID=A0ABT1J796_9ACTN|nr:hypothetical protein [Kitasatospora paracochleata]MCP2313314.1 hypothetical protein [Kitasatospora paracochleata]
MAEHAAYRNEASCSWSPDQQSAFREFSYGESDADWGQVDCTFKVNESWIGVSLG